MSELAIDRVLNAFRDWQNADQATRKNYVSDGYTDDAPGSVEQLKEREAAQRLETEVQIFIRQVLMAQQQITLTVPAVGTSNYAVPSSVAPLPVCECGHFRQEHLLGQGACGDITCGPPRCQEFRKKLQTGARQRPLTRDVTVESSKE